MLGLSGDEVQKTRFSADSIEGGAFVEVMLLLLQRKSKNKKVIAEFAQKCYPLWKQPLKNNNIEFARELLEMFKRLIE